MTVNVFESSKNIELTKPIKLQGTKYQCRWKKPISFSVNGTDFLLTAYINNKKIIFMYKAFLFKKWVYFVVSGMPRTHEDVEFMVNKFLNERRV